jgi:CHASE2 domain-containing sensor protein
MHHLFQDIRLLLIFVAIMICCCMLACLLLFTHGMFGPLVPVVTPQAPSAYLGGSLACTLGL